MKREELLKKIEAFAEAIGCGVAELSTIRSGVDSAYAMLVIDEIRVNIARLEGYLDDFERMVESGKLED